MTSRFSRILPLTFIALTGASLTPAMAAETPIPEQTMHSKNTQQVIDLLKSIETGDPKPVAHINPDKYIQHNLAVADGLAGFAALLKLLPPGGAKVNTVRAFQDGDHVFTHTEYDFFGPKIGFDIFRYENGRIVEHWDNLQDKPAAANPSGRTMTDGTTRVEDRDKTDANKRLVRAFVEDVLVKGEVAKLPAYIDGEHYLQHNPQIADGLSGLAAAFDYLAKAGIALRYERIHKVLGEGNFVLVVSEGEFAGKHTAFYDLFRVAQGKLVEHWDVLETIPPRSAWKNANGKF